MAPSRVVALGALLACAPSAQPRDDARATASPAARAAEPQRWPIAERARPLIAHRAAVASNSELASAVGVRILRRGGNAVDAAVAVGFALAVTHPEAGNLGGGGFMLVRMVRAGRGPVTAALDFREAAPAAATRDMFGTGSRSSTVGHAAVAVPGSVAGLLAAHERFGLLPRAAVVGPAIALAEEGFVVDSLLARSIRQSLPRIARYFGRDLLMRDGAALREGDTLRQPALARTLRRISSGGADAFYRGAIAAALAADMRENGGLITERDMASYRARWTQPVAVTYRGFTLVAPPLPSSGIYTAGAALLILEASGPAPAHTTTAGIHLTAAALQRAFIDRTQLGDPGATPSDVTARMLSRERAAATARSIPRDRAVPTPEAARETREGFETTHWSVVDASGNAVAATSTINDHFGSGVYVRSLGFFLNDTMDDFAAAPGRADIWGLVTGEANAIAPGKRALSSMTPFMVLDRDRRLALVAGARGGPRIISTVVQLVRNVVDHGMTTSRAISAPRIHHQASPDELWFDSGGFAEPVLDSLRAMGYRLRAIKPDSLPYIGRAVAIGRAGDAWEAIVDPRFGAQAVGY